MGVQVLEGRDGSVFADSPVKAVWYCNTTGRAFGPVFDSAEEAEAVLVHIHYVLGQGDLRQFTAEWGHDKVVDIAMGLREERGDDWFDRGEWDEFGQPIVRDEDDEDE